MKAGRGRGTGGMPQRHQGTNFNQDVDADHQKFCDMNRKPPLLSCSRVPIRLASSDSNLNYNTIRPNQKERLSYKVAARILPPPTISRSPLSPLPHPPSPPARPHPPDMTRSPPLPALQVPQARFSRLAAASLPKITAWVLSSIMVPSSEDTLDDAASLVTLLPQSSSRRCPCCHPQCVSCSARLRRRRRDCTPGTCIRGREWKESKFKATASATGPRPHLGLRCLRKL